MRILIAIPVVGDAFGQERVVRHLCEGLVARGHDPFLLGEQRGGELPPNQGYEIVEGITAFQFLSPRAQRNAANDRAMRFVEKVKPDLVHFMDQYNPWLTDSILEKYPGVMTCHTVSPTCPSGTRLIDGGGVCEKQSGWGCVIHHQAYGCLKFLKNDLRRVHAVHHFLSKRKSLQPIRAWIGISHYVAERMILDGYPKDRVHVVYNPVAVGGEIGKPTKIPKNLLVVASRLVPLKGIDFLIRALPQLLDLEWSVWICGEGSEDGNLKALVERSRLTERVRFLGATSYSETRQLLGSALAVVQTNVGPEAFGMTVAEALASGTPVVGFNIPAINEIVSSNKNGILVPRGDLSALASALRRFIENPGLAKQMGSAGPAWIKENFSVESHLNKTLGIYEAVVGRLPNKNHTSATARIGMPRGW